MGIDGYFEHRHATFGSVFGGTLHDVRQVTSKPVLLSETAAGQVSGQARSVASLFAGVERNRLLGLVWFDMRQDAGIHHQDWRIEGDPAALAAFRTALAGADSKSS